jgi:excinuclease ABC subunit A
MDKPQVDRIEGIPPAIAIEQRNTVKTSRSTVGTMTELCDYMKLLWPHLAQLHCRQCGQVVRKESPQLIWDAVQACAKKQHDPAMEVLLTFTIPLSEKLPLAESLALVAKQGYQRLMVENELVRTDEALRRLQKLSPTALTVIQDRLKLSASSRARFVEACEHGYHFGKGRLAVHWITEAPFRLRHSQLFSNRFHCAKCDVEYCEPTSALFSFNHPIGACPTCRGFGRIITIDYDRAIPDRSKTLAESVVKPWQSGQGTECQQDLMKFCKLRKVPTDVPFERLSRKWQDWVINGDAEYGKDPEHEWPGAWYGVKGYFRWLESKAYKMHVRVLLSRYRAYSTCPDCQGRRFQAMSLLFKVPDAQENLMSLADFYSLPVDEALKFIEHIATRHSAGPADPIGLVLSEVRSRFGYLVEVGLGYLTLDRPTRSLSGGETERVNLTTCLGTRLVNTLYVLDEPSVGLHARDTARLVRILENLRDLGNTVVVVEHEACVIRAANQIVDLGPGQGEAGGRVVFQGSFKELLRSPQSLTGQYLSGTKQIEIPRRRAFDMASPRLTVAGANRYNLKSLTVEIPLQRFVCLTGVSGSGKTTLAREVLLPALEARLKSHKSGTGRQQSQSNEMTEADEVDSPSSGSPLPTSALFGAENLGRIVLVDQSPLGKTPRSNPVVYIGAFDEIREVFAQTELARQRGLPASAFSFNSAQGQCERCRGAGFEKIEMQFLSDVFIRCPECNGRRYRPHILEVTIPVESRKSSSESQIQSATNSNLDSRLVRAQWSIADLLDATVDEATSALLSFIHTPPGRRAVQRLGLLQEVGLGYLRLGQPINTLSGGESQRLKLVTHLAEFARAEDVDAKPTLFVFDEPTTGLHFDDVRVLLKVFQRLVDAGHSLLVIEHNLDVIRSSDWVIDLGPEAGDRGGQVVVQGAPEQVAACAQSHTGQALREVGVDAVGRPPERQVSPV